MAVLGDVVDEEKLPKLLTSVDSMEHDFGFPLNMPPYEKYSPNVGRMSGMLPGCLKTAEYIAMQRDLRSLWTANSAELKRHFVL